MVFCLNFYSLQITVNCLFDLFKILGLKLIHYSIFQLKHSLIFQEYFDGHLFNLANNSELHLFCSYFGKIDFFRFYCCFILLLQFRFFQLPHYYKFFYLKSHLLIFFYFLLFFEMDCLKLITLLLFFRYFLIFFVNFFIIFMLMSWMKKFQGFYLLIMITAIHSIHFLHFI